MLNGSSAFVWSLLTDGMEVSAAVTALGEAFSISLDVARDGVDAALAGFSAEGLLEGGCPQRMSPGREDWHGLVSGPGLLEPVAWAFNGCYVVAGQQFVLCSEEQGVGEAVAALLQPLSAAAPGSSGAAIRLAVTASQSAEGRWDIYCSGRLCFSAVAHEALLPGLMTLIFERTCDALQEYFLFHAAVLVRSGKAFLLPARAGSGKTTLAAELATGDWTFFSDELALLDPLTRQVSPLALPMSIKPGSLLPLRKSYPGLVDLPIWDRADGQRVRYLLPPRNSLPGVAQTALVRKIVFPCFQAGGETRLEPLTKAVALQYLAETGSSNRSLKEVDIAAMVALVENADCYRLEHSDSVAAMEKIENLFGDG